MTGTWRMSVFIGVIASALFLSGALLPPLAHAQSDVVVIKRVQPKYPRRAAMARKEGYVTMSFTISTDGSVKDINVVKAKPKRVFDRAAVRALSQWVFEPVMVDGVPTDKQVTLTIDFKL